VYIDTDVKDMCIHYKTNLMEEIDCIDQQKRGRKEIIILYYVKSQHNHYKCSIQSIKP